MGKTCVITGASQGIGQAAAIRMSSDPGVTGIALIARNADGLRDTAAQMDHSGKEIRCYAYDLGDLDGIPGLMRRINDEFGSVDILLNIAGYADPQSLLDTTNDNIVRTYTINVFAMMVLIREAVRYMYDRPSKILNVASTAATTSRPGWLTYASSKAAVVSMSTTLADELAGTGIKIYTIAFQITDETTLGLLSDCASDPSKAFKSDNNDALLAAFSAIGDDISLLRISQ